MNSSSGHKLERCNLYFFYLFIYYSGLIEFAPSVDSFLRKFGVFLCVALLVFDSNSLIACVWFFSSTFCLNY